MHTYPMYKWDFNLTYNCVYMYVYLITNVEPVTTPQKRARTKTTNNSAERPSLFQQCCNNKYRGKNLYRGEIFVATLTHADLLTRQSFCDLSIFSLCSLCTIHFNPSLQTQRTLNGEICCNIREGCVYTLLP